MARRLPLEALRRHPDRAQIAASFVGQLAVLVEAQLDYKGLAVDRNRPVEALRSIGSPAK